MLRFSRDILVIFVVLLGLCVLALPGAGFCAGAIHFPLSYSEDGSRCPETIGIPEKGARGNLFYPVVAQYGNSKRITLDVVYRQVTFSDDLQVSFAGEEPEDLLQAQSFSYEAGEYGILSGVAADVAETAHLPSLPSAALLYKKGGWKPDWLGTFVEKPAAISSPDPINPVTKLLKLADVYLVVHRLLGGSNTFLESPEGTESKIFAGDWADSTWVTGAFDANGDGDLELLVYMTSGYADIPDSVGVVTVHEDKFSVCR